MSKLNERAMLASLAVSRWSAARTDKKVTAEVAKRHEVNAKVGHYRKFAIDVDAPTFKAVGTAAGDIRNRHYFYTLPWGQDGARILTALSFEDYSKEMRKLRTVFEGAVEKFVVDYPHLKENAKRELKGLYDESDYPRD